MQDKPEVAPPHFPHETGHHSWGSISKQVNTGAAAVRRFFAARHPDLRSSAIRFVASIIVFTHPHCRLEIDHPRTTVVRYSELLQAVLAMADSRKMPAAVASPLAQTLASSQTD